MPTGSWGVSLNTRLLVHRAVEDGQLLLRAEEKMKQFTVFLILGFLPASGFAGRTGCNLPLSTTDKGFEFSASSYTPEREPSKAQKQAPKAWCPKGSTKYKEYLQINLSSVRHISALETFGHESSYRKFYVKSFLLGYSLEGKKWKFYKTRTKSRSKKEFVGNKDTSSGQWNDLYPSFIAKHIRIYPLTFRNEMCMKVELYGCNKTLDCTHMIKLNDNEKVDISSPLYPNSYPTNAHCNWLISLPKYDTAVTVIAMDFDVGGGPNCTEEYVKVYNHLYSFRKHLAGTYCSSVQNMMPRVIKRNNEYLRISFNADSNADHHRGFKLMIWASNEGIKIAKSCENSTISLDCRGHDRNIEVIDAFYGNYQHSNTCTINATYSDPQLSKKSCKAPDVLPKLQETCDYRNVCQIAAEKNSFPHDCPIGSGTLEMFMVYQCNATEQIVSHVLPTSSQFFSSTKIIPSSSPVIPSLRSSEILSHFSPTSSQIFSSTEISPRSSPDITSLRTDEIVTHFLPTSSQIFSSTKNTPRSSPDIASLRTDAVIPTPTPSPTTNSPTTPPATKLPDVLPETTNEPDDRTQTHQTVKIVQKDEKDGLSTSIILVAAVPVAGFLIIIVIAVTVYCVCCKKTRKDKESEMSKMGVIPSESVHSKVMIQSDSANDLYEKIDDVEREMGKVDRYGVKPNEYSPPHRTQCGMSENPLYQSGDKDLSSSYDTPSRVRYIGASETSIKFPSSVPEPSYIDVLKSPEELPSNSIPMAKYLEPAHSPDHTAITIADGRYSSPPLSSSLPANDDEVYESMNGSVA